MKDKVFYKNFKFEFIIRVVEYIGLFIDGNKNFKSSLNLINIDLKWENFFLFSNEKWIITSILLTLTSVYLP